MNRLFVALALTLITPALTHAAEAGAPGDRAPQSTKHKKGKHKKKHHGHKQK